MNVDVTQLPGIGVRKDFQARSGRRIGVVTHRDGGIDLIVSKRDDPDDCAAQIPLTVDEAAVLANLLGVPQLVEKLKEDHRDLPGITTRQLPIGEDSPYSGRPLGETRLRTRTKASIVAVMRAGQIYPSPGPDFVLVSSDLLVVVGTPHGLDEALEILTGG
ncbi:cation:proton antiporter regulatory subunit [Nocardia sp. NPDC052254]|uniref:cation:proton antiporter regulatory subunit n=1 Tax=Nocardia sp. NPDC052254 TaxID=3155681 RepID=UPI003444ABC9